MEDAQAKAEAHKRHKRLFMSIFISLSTILGIVFLSFNRHAKAEYGEVAKIWERCSWTYLTKLAENLNSGIFLKDNIENAGYPAKGSILSPGTFPEDKKGAYVFGHMVNNRGLEVDIHFFLIYLGKDGLASPRTRLFIENFSKSSFKEKMAMIRAAAEEAEGDDIINFHENPVTIRINVPGQN